MKHTFLSVICLGVLLFGHAELINALEFELTGGINNMTYHPDRVTAHGLSAYFQSYPYGMIDLHIKGEASDKLDFDIHLSRDNILYNTLAGKIKTTSDYFNIEFGPYAGMSDIFSAPEMGIIGSMQFAYPGIAFLSLGGSASLGSDQKFLSDNIRETYDAKIGVWLPGLIPSLSYSYKNFIKHHEDDTKINDKLTRIQFGVDIFNKNLPVFITFNVGMETLTRSYSAYNISDELTAAYIGANVKLQISKPLAIIAGFETPIACSAKDPMKEPDNLFKLYKFTAGLSYTVF